MSSGLKDGNAADLFRHEAPPQDQRAGSLNDGHRHRLKERFTNAGENALPDYELLELVQVHADAVLRARDLGWIGATTHERGNNDRVARSAWCLRENDAVANREVCVGGEALIDRHRPWEPRRWRRVYRLKKQGGDERRGHRSKLARPPSR